MNLNLCTFQGKTNCAFHRKRSLDQKDLYSIVNQYLYDLVTKYFRTCLQVSFSSVEVFQVRSSTRETNTAEPSTYLDDNVIIVKVLTLKLIFMLRLLMSFGTQKCFDCDFTIPCSPTFFFKLSCSFENRYIQNDTLLYSRQSYADGSVFSAICITTGSVSL